MSKPTQAPGNENKGGAPVQGGAPKTETAPKAKGGHSVVPGHCHALGCKAPEKRFSFCDEHYEQFKFGLIKKNGEPVSDHEKKFEHYQAYKARLASARKVA